MRNALSTALAALTLLALSAGAGEATPEGSGPGPLLDNQQAPADAPSGAAKAHVILRCIVNADRSVDKCVVASEDPPGHGLGDAALRMARQIRIRPETFGPEMVGASVDIPIGFERDSEDDDMPSGVAAMPSP